MSKKKEVGRTIWCSYPYKEGENSDKTIWS